MINNISDYEHYLAHQVLPPIERLCEPIEGTDRARLAECLGKLGDYIDFRYPLNGRFQGLIPAVIETRIQANLRRKHFRHWTLRYPIRTDSRILRLSWSTAEIAMGKFPLNLSSSATYVFRINYSLISWLNFRLCIGFDFTTDRAHMPSLFNSIRNSEFASSVRSANPRTHLEVL